MKKKITAVLCLVSMLLAALLLSISAATPNKSYVEGDAVVIRFDSPEAIARIVNSTYGAVTGYLGGCLELKPYCPPGLITLNFNGDCSFSADEYQYMKIKYMSNSVSKTVNTYFATQENNDYSGERGFNFNRSRNKTWNEKVLHLSALSGNWKGMITGVRIDFFPSASGTVEADEYIFVEYIAFFKTKEAAESFGGLTAEQEQKTDVISKYADGYRSTRFEDITYEVPGLARPHASNYVDPVETDDSESTNGQVKAKRKSAAITNEQILIIAIVAILGIGAIAIAVIGSGSKPKQEEKEKKEEENKQ